MRCVRNDHRPARGVKDHFMVQQLLLVILKTGDRKFSGRHETVALRGVPGLDAVNVKMYRLATKDTKDRVQRPHPPERTSAPAL